jgi:DNA replication and repair protein RecF
MRLLRLRAERLRLFDAVELEPGPGLNLLLGPNGSGKTSLLEAVHLLGYGRSFRAGAREAVIQRDADALQVYAELSEGRDEIRHRLGLRRSARDWEARLDGAAVPTLGDLFIHCAVVCFEPGSHALIAGPAELRRRFLDWGLFHVERSFLPAWRQQQRALRQRNLLLRQGAPIAELEPWERGLAAAGETLHALRQGYVEALRAPLLEVAAAIFPEPGPPELRYQPGWRAAEFGLLDALVAGRDRDRQLGYTQAGPQRANWSVVYPTLPDRDSLSRGQEKLSALCCLLAQARHYAGCRGDWPILCLDDLGSELDRAHQAGVLDWLQRQPAQVLVTGTDAPHGLLPAEHRLFHVEQGRVQPLL